jgi:hypothetical protein
LWAHGSGGGSLLTAQKVTKNASETTASEPPFIHVSSGLPPSLAFCLAIWSRLPMATAVFHPGKEASPVFIREDGKHSRIKSPLFHSSDSQMMLSTTAPHKLCWTRTNLCLIIELRVW